VDKNGEDQLDEEVLRMKIGKYWTVFGRGNIDGFVMLWDVMAFYMKLLKAEWEVDQRDGAENTNATWFGKW